MWSQDLYMYSQTMNSNAHTTNASTPEYIISVHVGHCESMFNDILVNTNLREYHNQWKHRILHYANAAESTANLTPVTPANT